MAAPELIAVAHRQENWKQVKITNSCQGNLNCAARYLEFDGAKLWDLNYRPHGNVAPKPLQPKHTSVMSVAQACATNSGDRESGGQAVERWRRHLPNQPSSVELGFECRKLSFLRTSNVFVDRVDRLTRQTSRSMRRTDVDEAPHACLTAANSQIER